MDWDEQITRKMIPELLSFSARDTIYRKRKYLDTILETATTASLFMFFSDTSYNTLAGVAYFVYSNSATRQISSAIVLGKARVAPLKEHTKTKLEKQAAVFGTCLAKFIRREQRIHISSTNMWTDSTTALQWIQRSAKRQQISVAHRIAENLKSTQAGQWKHYP